MENTNGSNGNHQIDLNVNKNNSPPLLPQKVRPRKRWFVVDGSGRWPLCRIEDASRVLLGPDLFFFWGGDDESAERAMLIGGRPPGPRQSLDLF